MAKPVTLEDLLQEAQVLKIDTKGLDTIEAVAEAINAKKDADAIASKSKKKVKIEILKPVAGTYKLSANVGDTISIEAKQADEMIDNGYAKKA